MKSTKGERIIKKAIVLLLVLVLMFLFTSCDKQVNQVIGDVSSYISNELHEASSLIDEELKDTILSTTAAEITTVPQSAD